MKIILIVLVLVILGLGIYFLMNFQEDVKQYQGPVPEGYDLEHYRLTGETIPLSGGEYGSES